MSNGKKTPKGDGRFQKGISGNPKGRPPKGVPKEISLLDHLVSIEFEGKVQKVTPDVAAVATLWVEGLGRNSRSMEAFLKNFKKFRESEPEGRSNVRILYRLPMRMGRADNALRLLRVRKISEGMFKVDNWVLDEALKRNPHPDLINRDLDNLSASVTNAPLAKFRLLLAKQNTAKPKPE